MSAVEEPIVWPPRRKRVINQKKVERNLEIVHQVYDHGRTYADVGKEFGITSVRVGEICRNPRSWQPPMDAGRRERKAQKIGTIRQLASGRWLVDVRHEALQRCRSVDTEAEAEALLTEWRNEVLG